MSQADVVVIGGGQAGIQAADSLRSAARDRGITVLADEVQLPYQRPPLSKSLWDPDLRASCLPLRSEAFFGDRGIRILRGTRAIGIDRDRHTVTVESGETLTYSALVLATGSRARTIPVPGAELAGVHLLRTLDDGSALQRAVRNARSLVVVGGGFIGLEVAAAATANGVKATVLELQPRILQRALTPCASEWLTDYHTSQGTAVRLGTGASAITGARGRVRGVVTDDDEEIAADVVVVGAGAVPNVELARQAGLDVTDGIVVDAALRTSDPAVWAIGDCARFPDTHRGTSLRLESVQNATDQARCAAANIAAALNGEPCTDYDEVAWFWSHQGGARLQIAGVGDTGTAQVVVRRHSGAKVSFLAFENGQLTVVESINAPADHMAARRLLAARIRVDPEAVSDPAVPLKSLVTG